MKKFADNNLPSLNSLMLELREQQAIEKKAKSEAEKLKTKIKARLDKDGLDVYFANIPGDEDNKLQAYKYTQTQEKVDKAKAAELLGAKYGEVFKPTAVECFAVRAIATTSAAEKMEKMAAGQDAD